MGGGVIQGLILRSFFSSLAGRLVVVVEEEGEGDGCELVFRVMRWRAGWIAKLRDVSYDLCGLASDLVNSFLLGRLQK